MKHDLEHEKLQDQMLSKLAATVASLAALAGFKQGVAEAHEVMKALAADLEEPASLWIDGVRIYPPTEPES